MKQKIFHLYRVQHKVEKYEAFMTWFKSPKLAFAPLKAKYNKYVKRDYKFAQNYNPENFEVIEYEIKPVRTIQVNQD
jgi:hypothetical protein